MKILIDGRVLTHKFTTGVQKYTYQIIEAIKYENINFEVFYPSTTNRFFQHIWEHSLLPLKAKDYDVLFCPGNVAPFWIPSNVKLVSVLHSLAYIAHPEAYSDSFRFYYKFLIPIVLKNSKALVVVSESEKKNIIKYYPWCQNKIYVVQNGVDEIFLKQNIEFEKEKYILYVGSMNPLKNFSGLIEAFLKISDKIPHKLIVVGPELPIFKKKIRKKADRIIFMCSYNEFQLAELYRKAALFVLPSFYEASPLPPIEAMACGCPVLVSNIPAMIERCGDAAEFCNPYDKEDIAKKILEVLNDKNKVYCMIEKGRKRAELFSWKTVAKEIIRIFQQII